MAPNRLVSTLFFIQLVFWEIDAYGKVVEPIHRGAAWRKGFDSPVNYDDHVNNCGGFAVHHHQNNGDCGPCGDNHAHEQPRKNENGGHYGTGAIVREYKVNQAIDVNVNITANLKGYFELSLCKLSKPDEVETEACFEANPLYVNGTSQKYYLPKESGPLLVHLKVDLPKDLTCEHCVLRWHYRGGNNWGVCEDGSGRLGCGRQEIFRTCSDVSILE